MSDSGLIDRLAAGQDYPAGTLYLVATPIGNLADITLRSLACLARMDVVAAEDTRTAKRLLSQYGLSRPTLALHQHNELAATEGVIARLRQGERVAYLSDAGTPAISDPGTRLVDGVLAAGLRVIPLPGASAVVCAVSVAGLSDGPFYFAGFLPARRSQAVESLTALLGLHAQLVFYEAPHRVLATVKLLASVLGLERRVVIARELTKLHESIERLRLGDAAAFLEAHEDRQRGEFVLVVEGAPTGTLPDRRTGAVLERLLPLMPLSEAVALATELTGASRNDIYAQALALRDASPSEG